MKPPPRLPPASWKTSLTSTPCEMSSVAGRVDVVHRQEQVTGYRCGQMAVAQRPPALRGRSSERQALDRLVADAHASRSGVLVIRGEAGVGKTVLMRYAADRASGFRVAQISGVESEMELPFAGLHQLCAPLLDRLDALPAPQQDALRVALGAASGAAPDRFPRGPGDADAPGGG